MHWVGMAGVKVIKAISEGRPACDARRGKEAIEGEDSCKYSCARLKGTLTDVKSWCSTRMSPFSVFLILI